MSEVMTNQTHTTRTLAKEVRISYLPHHCLIPPSLMAKKSQTWQPNCSLEYVQETLVCIEKG